MNWERTVAIVIFFLAGVIAVGLAGYEIGEWRIVNEYEEATRICRDLRS